MAAAQVSRRTFLSGGAALLGGFGLSQVVPRRAEAQPEATDTTDLALYRPVTVSSTQYGPRPAEFAVDGLAEVGVRGTGWRADGPDPQWIAVDLQAPCRVESVVLVFEATTADPEWQPAQGSNPYNNTTGWEVMSSCATAFTLDVSVDGSTWSTVYQTTSATGGVVPISLPAPVTARWVRMTASQQSNGTPLQVNGFAVYGTSAQPRPLATGWSDWRHGQPTEPPALRLAADGTVPIESGWAMTLDDWAGSTDGAALSRGHVDPTGWVDALVPGTVLASLVEQGHFPDPVTGFNNLHIPEALSRHSWWYRRIFQLPRGLRRPGQRIWLEFDGINHHAEIWLNGSQIGELTHPFGRGAFDVTSALGNAEQVLAVRIDPMPHPGNPGDKGPAGVSFLNSSEVHQDFPSYISVSGWDWMPAVRDRVSGIWDHVRLRATGPVLVGDPRVDTRLPNLPRVDLAELSILVPVRNAGAVARPVTVQAVFDNVRVQTTVSVPAGSQTDVTFAPEQFPQLRISNPELWWPNGYGDPALHELTITVSAGGSVSDRRTHRFGIRQFDYSGSAPVTITNGHSDPQVEQFPAQHARYVRIQGGRRATGFGISMWTLSVMNSANPGTDLALHQTATASSVDDPSRGPEKAVDGDPNTRWSSAYQDNQWITVDLGQAQDFDEVAIVWEVAYAADYTIQVSNDGATWTDVKSVSNASTPLAISVNGVPVFCRGGNWGWDELLRRMLPQRMNDVMAMHRDMNFTMIRNWGGCSSREEFYAGCDENGILLWNEFWEGDGLFPPDQNDDAFLAQARDMISRSRIHPCIAVWCGANESTPPAAIDAGLAQAVAELDPGKLYHSNSAQGISSSGGPYWYVDPGQYFSGNYFDVGHFGFHTEIGLPTVPVAESMQNLAGDQPAWPIGGPWYLHDWCIHGNQQPASYQAAIEQRLGTGTSLEDFCRKAQFVNYENIRAMFEAWNANLWNDATGLMLWMSNPAHHSTVWQTYDYDLDVNGTYFGARKGCEPVHVQARATDWQVQVVNNTAAALTGVTASAQVFALDGTPQGSAQQQVVDVPASASRPAFTITWPWNVVTFAPVSARYVRMFGLTRATQWGFSIYEMSVYGPDQPDTNLALHQPATASSTDESDHGPENAVDGDPTTRWSSAYQDDQWLQVDLQQVVAVDKVTLSWETAMAETFEIQTSTDGTTWTTAQTVTVRGTRLVRLQLHDASGALLSDNRYWNYAAAQDMQALNSLPQAQLSVSAHRLVDPAQRATTNIAVSVQNNGPAIAAMTVLSLRGAKSGQRVLPAFYDDNYVWLLPGESRDFTVKCATSALAGEPPAVRVAAYNSAAQTIRA